MKASSEIGILPIMIITAGIQYINDEYLLALSKFIQIIVFRK